MATNSNMRPESIAFAVIIVVMVLFSIAFQLIKRSCIKRQCQSSINYTANQMPLNTISSNIPLSPLGNGGVPAVYVIPNNANRHFPGSTGNQTIQNSPYSTSPTFADPYSADPTFASPYSPSQNSFLASGPHSNHGNIYTNQPLDNTSSNFIPGSANQPVNSTIYSDQLPPYSENQGDKLPPYRDNIS